MKLFAVLLSAILSCSFIIDSKNGDEYKNMFIGKKISETPYADYIKEDLSGDNLIMIVNFDCHLCVEATNDAGELKKASLVKNIIVLGSTFGATPADSLEADFKTKIKADVSAYYDFDPEFEVYYKKILAIDPSYPQDKHAIYVKDNFVKGIFLKVPTVKEFSKIVKK